MKKILFLVLALVLASCTINYSKKKYTVQVKMAGDETLKITVDSKGYGKKDFENKIAVQGRPSQPIGTEVVVSKLIHADRKISFTVTVTKIEILDNFGKISSKSTMEHFLAFDDKTWYESKEEFPYSVQVSNHH